MDLTISLGLMLAAVVGLAFASFAPAHAILSAGLLQIGYGLTWLPMAGATTILGVGTLGLGILRHSSTGSSTRRPAAIAFIPMALGLLGLGLAPMVAATNEAASEAVTTLIMAAVVLGSARWLAPQVAVRSSFNAMGIAVGASAVAIVLGVAEAFEMGRARGLFENANGLGPAAVLWACLSLGRSRWIQVSVFTVAGWLLVETSSRTSFAALLVVMVVALWGAGMTGSESSAGARVPRRALLVLGLLVGSWLWTQFDPSTLVPSEGLLRAGDSGRGELAQEGWLLLRSAPWVGHGVAATSADGLSTSLVLPIRWAAGLGISGVLLWLASLVAIAVAARRGDSVTRTLLAVGVVYMLSEPWFVAPGSMTSWTFWIVIATLTAQPRPTEEARRGPPVPAAEVLSEGPEFEQGPSPHAPSRAVSRCDNPRWVIHG